MVTQIQTEQRFPADPPIALDQHQFPARPAQTFAGKLTSAITAFGVPEAAAKRFAGDVTTVITGLLAVLGITQEVDAASFGNVTSRVERTDKNTQVIVSVLCTNASLQSLSYPFNPNFVAATNISDLPGFTKSIVTKPSGMASVDYSGNQTNANLTVTINYPTNITHFCALTNFADAARVTAIGTSNWAGFQKADALVPGETNQTWIAFSPLTKGAPPPAPVATNVKLNRDGTLTYKLSTNGTVAIQWLSKDSFERCAVGPVVFQNGGTNELNVGPLTNNVGFLYLWVGPPNN